jgi:hypothetical protein
VAPRVAGCEGTPDRVQWKKLLLAAYPEGSTHLMSNKFVACGQQWTASVVWWSEFLATDPEVRFRFSALPDFLSSGSGKGSTQPRENN